MEQPGISVPPPPPPPSSVDSRPRLERVAAGRWVAGVAVGAARHLGIDPVIVRIAFVALSFFGGTGIGLYGAAWLLIPAEGDDRSLAQQWTRDADGRWRLAGVAAVALGGSILAGQLGNGNVIAPLLLVAVGAWLLVRSDDEPTRESGSELVPPDDPTAAPMSAPVSGPASVAPAAPPPSAPASALTEPRPTPFLTPLVLAVLMLIGGLAVLAARADLFAVAAAGVLAVCLVVVGIALLISVWWGRARGLIPLGLVLAAGIGLASVFSFPLWSGVGERIVDVEQVAQVEDPIHHGIGELLVDLTEIDADGGRVDVEAGVSIGELRITVPDEVDVEVTASASAGSLAVFDEVVDGLDRTLTTERSGSDPDSGSLALDLEVGFGEVRVDVES